MHLAPPAGITVREHCFTHLAYTDNAVVLPNEDQAATTLAAFSEAAALFDLKSPGPRQNYRVLDTVHNPPTKPSLLWKVYKGKQTSDGRSLPDVMTTLVLSSAAMSSVKKIWNN